MTVLYSSCQVEVSHVRGEVRVFGDLIVVVVVAEIVVVLVGIGASFNTTPGTHGSSEGSEGWCSSSQERGWDSEGG